MIAMVMFLPNEAMATLLTAENAKTNSQEEYTVTMVPASNGSYTVTPQIPADGKLPAGTELTIKAKAASDYRLDAVYYTYKGGMWGTTSVESFKPRMKVIVDRDMSIGATFVPGLLVDNIKVIHDVVYAKPGVKTLKYDVYAPKGADNLPCIVIIHGGGWSSNNEDIMRGLARELTKRNEFVVFSIDYRWINNLDGDEEPNYMHHLIEDVFGAIAHIQQNAKKYGGDPTRIAVTGDSAGGHLSESAATLSTMIGDRGFGEQTGVYEYLPTYIPKGKTVDQVREEILTAIKAVAPSYGPSHASEFKMFIQQTDETYWDAVSPSKHVPNVKERALPHFIVRGTEDPLINHEMVQGYVDILEEAGQYVEYVQVDGAGHAFFDWKPDATTRATFIKFGISHASMMREFFLDVFEGEYN